MSKSRDYCIVLAVSTFMFLVVLYGLSKDKGVQLNIIDNLKRIAPSVWLTIGISIFLIVLTSFLYRLVKHKNINAVKAASRRYNRLLYNSS